MKKILQVVFLLNVLFMFSAVIHADSPITATGFYEAYLDVKMVERAHLEGVMGLEIAEFLTSPENPIDVKAAVINALSWRFDGKNNAELYKVMKESFTVSIILALARGQNVMDYDWCEVWRLTEEVLTNKELRQDLRPEATKMIIDYMVLYKEYCK